MSRTIRAVVLGACVACLLPIASSAQVDKTMVDYVLAKDIKWVKNAAGTQEQAVLFGDPNKPGPYVARIKWLPGGMSRPHTHPNDRYFVVLSGTWWVGSGDTYAPDTTVPMPPGSYVIHYAGKPHYDGAKNEETIIQVWGMGPTTTTQVERK